MRRLEAIATAASSTFQVSFREEQRFRQPWVWAIVIPCAILAVGVFGWGMIQQLVLGQPLGNQPLPDTALLIVGPLMILVFGLGLPWLFYVTRLEVEVRDDHVWVRFFGLRTRRVPYSEIASCEAVTYRPIGEYGGWGIRWGGAGKWAYSVRGDRGVQIVYEAGQMLLIGSQRAEELAAAIREKLASHG